MLAVAAAVVVFETVIYGLVVEPIIGIVDPKIGPSVDVEVFVDIVSFGTIVNRAGVLSFNVAFLAAAFVSIISLPIVVAVFLVSL